VETIDFDFESELVDVIHSSSKSGRVFQRSNTELIVVPELAVGGTTPDLVIVRASCHPFQRHIRLTLFESWLVGELLSSGHLHDTTLTQRLFTPIDSTRASLERLERVGIVKRTQTGTYAVVTKFSGRFEILSIEAKLSRWRAALRQAKAYRRFSDQSYVALPESTLARLPQIRDTCTKEGVGIIGVTQHGIRIVAKPSLGSPDLREWMWVLSRADCVRI
jgi:hypothetical protein